MIRRLSFCAVLCALAACGNIGSRYVKAENVSTKGAVISVAATDNAQLAGTALAIPSGALAAQTVITVDLVNGSLLDTDLAAGPTVEWGPAGTRFSAAAEMQLPYTAGAQDEIFVQVQEANGERFEIDPSAITVDTANKLVRFRVNGFTRFQAGARRQCKTDSQCAAGKTCRTGRCAETCSANADCSTGASCVNGACQSQGTVCVSNAQCLTNQACLSNHCTSFDVSDGGVIAGGGGANTDPNLDAGVAVECSANRDCGSNQLCVSGICYLQTCTDSKECGLGSVCSSGVCASVDADGGVIDLDAGVDLDGGAAGDGGLGAHCVNNAQCGSDAYCGLDYQCHGLADAGVDGGVFGGDGGIDGGHAPDSGVIDADGGVDGGEAPDAGVVDADGGLDGGEAPDAGVVDADGGVDGGMSCRADFDCLTGQHCSNHVCQ